MALAGVMREEEEDEEEEEEEEEAEEEDHDDDDDDDDYCGFVEEEGTAAAAIRRGAGGHARRRRYINNGSNKAGRKKNKGEGEVAVGMVRGASQGCIGAEDEQQPREEGGMSFAEDMKGMRADAILVHFSLRGGRNGEGGKGGSGGEEVGEELSTVENPTGVNPRAFPRNVLGLVDGGSIDSTTSTRASIAPARTTLRRDFYLSELQRLLAGEVEDDGTGMWADSSTTTMSIVICAGVPSIPLVGFHHLHGAVSTGRGLCRGHRLRAKQ
ncbi:hypothetical protein KM043_013718 [Ampulex compressa]|nr:hypothetical protein KM043_013718 [Ampulex compressa]